MKVARTGRHAPVETMRRGITDILLRETFKRMTQPVGIGCHHTFDVVDSADRIVEARIGEIIFSHCIGFQRPWPR